MHLVTSQEEYQKIIREAKTQKGAKMTNCYLFPEAIQRWIDLKRLYTEELDTGVLFLADQERYYSVYFYLNPAECPVISRLDKPQVIQTIYQGSIKNEKQCNMDQILQKAGFIWKDRMQQIKSDPVEVLKKITPLCNRLRSRWKNEGFNCRALRVDELSELDRLMYETPEIPFYEFNYFSRKELEEQAEAGQLAGIFHHDKVLCAAYQLFMEGNTAYSWFAIDNQYKVEYGLALMLKEIITTFITKKGCVSTGWVDVENRESVLFHRKLGYHFMEKYREHWLFG